MNAETRALIAAAIESAPDPLITLDVADVLELLDVADRLDRAERIADAARAYVAAEDAYRSSKPYGVEQGRLWVEQVNARRALAEAVQS